MRRIRERSRCGHCVTRIRVQSTFGRFGHVFDTIFSSSRLQLRSVASRDERRPIRGLDARKTHLSKTRHRSICTRENAPTEQRVIIDERLSNARQRAFCTRRAVVDAACRAGNRRRARRSTASQLREEIPFFERRMAPRARLQTGSRGIDGARRRTCRSISESRVRALCSCRSFSSARFTAAAKALRARRETTTSGPTAHLPARRPLSMTRRRSETACSKEQRRPRANQR
jgi:hypothetical protein